jgi:hypothetical protein
MDDGGMLVDPATKLSPPEDETYPIARQKAFEPFIGHWVPLPFLRVDDPTAQSEDVRVFGPTNWVRMRIAELPEPDEDGNSHAMVLAFDTALRETKQNPFPSLAPEDSRRGATFALHHLRDSLAWFLNQKWLARWLQEMLLEFLARGRRGKGAPPTGRPCEHWARYIALLEVLGKAEIVPAVKLIDVVSETVPYQPIPVDLVLDIGNSRTCGLVVEHGRGDKATLNNSFPLKLRDLERADLAYERPFESRVEFANASFGRDALSRQSGAATFQWPSPVRIGPEAMRLAAAARGNEGATGLSSPKRYLWDERATAQVWRSNGIDPFDGVTVEPPVTGALMRHVSQEGEVLRAPRRGRRGAGLTPAQRARFSRSSLMTFLLAEILMQALSQINSVEARYARSFPEVPRRLTRIILTMPPAMPLAEQRIFRDRAKAATALVWELLGLANGATHAPPEPRSIITNLDEATATQIVFLYSEVSQRLRGDPAAFFALTGKPRAKYGAQPSLRVASIDVGGGTTDLMICTFVSEHGQEITPDQNFREGFRIAGDDVLQDVIQSIVVPQFEDALAAAGARDAKALLQELLGGEKGAQSEAERHARRQFVAQVLEPIGLAVLHASEDATDRNANEILRRSVGELLQGKLVAGPMEYFRRLATRAGAPDFDPLLVEIVATAKQTDAIVQASIGPILADLCEVVHAFDCDWLLVSGRPSRLRAVMDMLLAKLPVPPHRIIGMHNYVAGSWYPFRDPAGRIYDPKTTAAVGAMLSTLAEGGLEGFLLRSSRLSMKSTAKYLGRMELSGRLPRANVLLEDPDRVRPKTRGMVEQEEVGFKVGFRAPMSLGFRQLDLERWQVTKLYVLEYANPDSVKNLDLPLTISIVRAEIDPDAADAEERREDFTIESIEDSQEAPVPKSLVTLRLQTEKTEAGYWRDTGLLSVP